MICQNWLELEMDKIMNNILGTIDIPYICGFGLHMQFDGFRILYVLIATFMWAVSLTFSLEYISHYKNKSRYYFFLILTYFATVGVFLSVDFYTTFIFFEIMSLASYVWVAFDEKKGSLRAAGTYLAVAIIGGLVMLMGIFLLYDIAGTLTFSELEGLYESLKASNNGESVRLMWAGLCLLFGFGAKAGAFPLHIWLPKAHPVAPAPASALLSGILTKTGIFGILILACYIFKGNETFGALIFILALCTMVIGAVLALFSVNLKRTLAASSVSQIGFILTGIGLSGLMGEENAMALRGSLLHMVNHSLLKLVLFSAAGVVFMNIHSLNLNDIRGFGRKKPMLNAIFLSGVLGIGGIPLFNGYISKTLLHESIVEYGEMLNEGLAYGIFDVAGIKTAEWIFIISGGFTLAYMLKLYICIFIEKNEDAKRQEIYDNNKKYMNIPTSVALCISAVLLPLMGILPKAVMDRMADISSDFLRIEELAYGVAYFSLENIKGAAMSIAIGLIIYFAIVRTWLMRDSLKEGVPRHYVNRWPKWMDLEDYVYRPVILYALPFAFGVISRAMDSMVDTLVVLLRKSIYRDSPIRGELAEGTAFTHFCGTIANAFARLGNKIFKKNNNTDYVHKFAIYYDTYSENRFIIARSMSFGLMLFCLGLVATVVYVLIKKLTM